MTTVVTVKKQSRKVKYREYLLNSTPLLNILHNFLVTEGFEEAPCDLSSVRKQCSEEKKGEKEEEGEEKTKKACLCHLPVSIQLVCSVQRRPTAALLVRQIDCERQQR